MKTHGHKSLPYYVTSLSIVAALCLWLAYRILGAMTMLYKQERLDQQLLLVKTTALQFEAELHNHLKLLKACAARPELWKLIQRRQWEPALSLMQDSLASGGTVEILQLFDPAGKLKAEFPPVDPGSRGQNSDSEVWYPAFAKSWIPSISKVYRRGQSPQVWVFLEAVPLVSSNGTRLGILTAQIPVTRILSKLETLSPDQTGICYIVDRNGVSLAHYGNSKTDSDMPAISQKTSLISEVVRGDSGAMEYEDQYRRTSYLSAFVPAPDLGASFVREIPVQSALRGLRLFFIVMGSLGLLIVVITSRFFWAWNDAAKKQKVIEKLHEIEQLKTDFLSIASHELRTPLTSLREGISLLLDEPSENLSEIQHSLVTIIDRNAKRLCNLVNDILDVSTLEAGKTLFKKDKIAVRELLTAAVDSVRTHAETKALSVNILMEEISPAFGDSLRLQQVLTNLLHNSIKCTPAGGRIDVSAVARAGEIQFCVADTGAGMKREHQKHLFDKFHNVPQPREEGSPGTELGLANCKKIVDANDGKIWVESKPAEGTRVFFTVPQFTPGLWWAETWKELRTQNPPSGVGMVGIRTESKAEGVIPGFESRIRTCIKKRDHLLCEPEAGMIWVLACAKDVETEKIASRINSTLETYVAENHLTNHVQFRISWDHFLQDKITEPLAPAAALAQRLNENARAA
jgi:signal transduction histidine kinase